MLLAIDSSTHICSVALWNKGQLIALKEEGSADYIHAEKLNVFIEEILKQEGITPNQLQAVAVASGPGSYTGLRIGISSAKGLCYALKIPLIAVDPLHALAMAYIERFKPAPNCLLVPCIDARRMEIFMAVYSAHGQQLESTRAQIVDESFLQGQQAVIMGDGAAKLRDTLQNNSQIQLADSFLTSAKYIAQLGEKLWHEGKEVDVAYFEPYYGKDFQVSKPKASGS